MEHSIGEAILPFKIQQLLMQVIEKKKLNLQDALYYLYSSALYKQLFDEGAKLWYLSTDSLYAMLQREKHATRVSQNNTSNMLLFQVFCLESYREKKKKRADEVLCLFSEYLVFEFIGASFDLLHTQGREYIVAEIDIFIKNRRQQ